MTAEVLGVQQPVQQPAWIPDDTRFGARLALIRQHMAWGNVKEAALACGVPVESWRTWERDNVKPQRYEEICRKIAQHSGCDLDWLMRGHKFGYVPVATRPRDNRPSGRPRASDRGDNGRRAQRLRTGPAGTPLRSAA